MTTFCTFVEIEVVAPVKEIQAVQDVLASVRVYDIKKNRKTQSVGSVYQLFEILWSAIAGACGEKAGNLITKC